MHRRSRGSGGGNGTGLGSPRSRRIREADSFSRSNVGAGRGDFGAGRRRSRSNGSNGSNGSTGSNINNAGYGASMAAAAGSGGRVGLEIQAELVAALAKCEAALKQKTHEVHKLNTQLANARSEAGLSGKQAQEQLSRVRADMEELRERSNEAIDEAQADKRAAVEAARKSAEAAISAARQSASDEISKALREKEEAVAAAQKEKDAAVTAALRDRDERVAAAVSEKEAAVAAAQQEKEQALTALRTKYQRTLAAIKEQSTANNREMQDAVASLTRQLNAAETAKAEAEAHSASLDVKVAEAEQAEEKIRAAQRSMAALESQISEFQDIVLRQRAVIGDLNREAAVASAAQTLVTDSLQAAKASASGTGSPRASVTLPASQKLTGIDLRLQQELILKYEELLRFKEAEAANDLRELQAKHADEIEEIQVAHREQMARLRDVCQAQLLNFSAKHQALQEHMQVAGRLRNSGSRSLPPSSAPSTQHVQRFREGPKRLGAGASISLDRLGAQGARFSVAAAGEAGTPNDPGADGIPRGTQGSTSKPLLVSGRTYH